MRELITQGQLTPKTESSAVCWRIMMTRMTAHQLQLISIVVLSGIMAACTKPGQPTANEAAPQPQPQPAKSRKAVKTVGEYKLSETKFYLRTSNSAGDADNVFFYGPSGQ